MGFVVKAVKSVVKAIVKVAKAVVFGVAGLVLGGLRKKGNAKNKASDKRLSKQLDPEDFRKIVLGETAMAVDLRFWEVHGAKFDRYAEVLAAAGHKVESFGDFYLEEELVTFSGEAATGKYAGVLTRKTNSGAPGNAAIAMGSGSFWNSTSKFTGTAHYGLDWLVDDKKLPNGVPSRYTQVGKGALVYDPRKDSTRGGSGSHRAEDQSTWEYAPLDSNGKPIGRNNALQMLWYLLGWKVQNPGTSEVTLVCGRGVDVNDINFLDFIAAANDAEAMGYYSDMILSTGDEHETNEAIISADGLFGEILDPGGLWTYKVTRDDTADVAVHLTDHDIVDGEVTWDPQAANEDIFNEIAGTYIDPSATSLYQSKAYPTVKDATYLADDGGRRKRETHNFQSVQDPALAQKLARIKLNRTRFTGEFQATFNLRALKAQAWSVVKLSLERYGFVEKLFRVVSQSITPFGIDMVLKEEDPSIYVNGTVTIPAPPSAMAKYDVRMEIPVEGISGTPATRSGVGGAAEDGLIIAWSVPPGNVRRTEVQFKRTADTAWTGAMTGQSDQLQSFIGPLMSSAQYNARVRHVSIHEIPGPWATINVTTGANGRVTSAQVTYANGATIESLKPAEAGANVTETRVASAITGQGPGATAIGSDVLNNRIAGTTVSIPRPVGGMLSLEGPVTGALKIKLPVKGTGHMMRFTLRIYDYLQEGSTTYQIGGYNYVIDNQWTACFADMTGPRNRSFPVRFGHDGVNDCIWVGNPDTVWSYPKFFINDFVAGFGTPDANLFDDGWQLSIDVATSTNVSNTVAIPRSGDALFGEGVFEGNGSGVATLPNFKTAQGTAAAIAGQGAWATDGSLSPLGVSNKIQYIKPNGYISLGVGGGITNNAGSAWLGDADLITSQGISSAIAGQGYFATRNYVYGGGPGTLGDGRLLNETNSRYITDVGYYTPEGTASAIAGQGPWATTNTGTVPDPSTINSRVQKLTNSGRMRFGSENGITTEGEAQWVTDALAVTGLGTSAAIVGQGSLATRGTVRVGFEVANAAGALLFEREVLNNRLEGQVSVIPEPGGGVTYLGTEATGAIKIVLPFVGYTMVKFDVETYSYAGDKTGKFSIGGYTYPDSNGWINTSATLVGHSAMGRNVRFGYDASIGKFYICIGELNSYWEYTQVRVTNFQASYTGQDPSNWDDGWSIVMQTGAFPAFSQVTFPTAGPAVFGLNAQETYNGAVATVPNFKTAQGTAAAISGQAPAATDASIEAGADVTSFVVGAATFTIEAASDGTPTAALLPKTVAYKLMKNASDLTASATWTRTLLSGGLTSAISAGTLSVTGMTTDEAIVRLQAALGSVTRTIDVKVLRNKAAAAPPSGGGTTASTGSFNAVNSVSQTVMTADLDINVGAAGTATLTAPLEFYAISGTGTYGLNLIWQRWNGSSWVDVGSVATADPFALRYNEGPGEIYSEPGFVSCSATVTGLSGAQKFRLTGYVPSGTVSRSAVGTATATGS